MAEFHLDPDAIDFDSLPPLVRKGESRQEVIGALVAAWCEPIVEDIFPWQDVAPGVTLNRVRLDDENHEIGDARRAIDLIEVLSSVTAELRRRGVVIDQDDTPALGSNRRIVLRGCLVRSCLEWNYGPPRTLPFDVVTRACRFDCDLAFDSVRAGGDLVFRSARVSGNASFIGARVRGNLSFMSARIGESAWFVGTRVGRDASFILAHMGEDASFASARVGRDAQFGGVRVKGDASFDSICVGGQVNFEGARMGGDMSFDRAGVGSAACFNGARVGGAFHAVEATFVSGSFFLNTEFSYRASVSGPWIHSANMGRSSAEAARFTRRPPVVGWRRIKWRFWEWWNRAHLHWGWCVRWARAWC